MKQLVRQQSSQSQEAGISPAQRGDEAGTTQEREIDYAGTNYDSVEHKVEKLKTSGFVYAHLIEFSGWSETCNSPINCKRY